MNCFHVNESIHFSELQGESRLKVIKKIKDYIKMTKVGRNDVCHCGSGKKYKKCCLDYEQQTERTEREHRRQRIIYGDEWSSPELKNMADALISEFPDHAVIDVSHVADSELSYKQLQLQHYTAKVVMLLERNEINEELFEERVPPFISQMALYRGAYSSIEGRDLTPVSEMIHTRLTGRKWEP